MKDTGKMQASSNTSDLLPSESGPPVDSLLVALGESLLETFSFLDQMVLCSYL